MPGRSDAAALSENAIRERAYHLWEADGRPDGRGDHYWHLASEEARNAMVEETASRTAAITGGKNPSEMPPKVKSGTRAKGKAADEGKAAKPVKAKAKAAEAAPKKSPKPRAAVQKAL